MSCVGVLSRLHNAVGNLATYICLRQSFVAISFERCQYFLAHVACRNLPWQGLMSSCERCLQVSLLEHMRRRRSARLYGIERLVLVGWHEVISKY